MPTGSSNPGAGTACTVTRLWRMGCCGMSLVWRTLTGPRSCSPIDASQDSPREPCRGNGGRHRPPVAPRPRERAVGTPCRGAGGQAAVDTERPAALGATAGTCPMDGRKLAVVSPPGSALRRWPLYQAAPRASRRPLRLCAHTPILDPPDCVCVPPCTPLRGPHRSVCPSVVSSHVYTSPNTCIALRMHALLYHHPAPRLRQASFMMPRASYSVHGALARRYA